MVILGYFAALLIGLSLGLIGGGGSILTVPVLVYLFHIDPVLATAYSLFIVGFTSLVGSVPKYRMGEVNLKMALLFGFPSIIAVYLTRAFLVPLIPEIVYTWNGFQLTKSLLMLLLFAVLMILAAITMIRKQKSAPEFQSNKDMNYILIITEGFVVGTITGLVGAGGGFIIIPALVILSKLPMKQAVGTSLVIIAAKSLIGFTGDLGHRAMDWNLLGSVTALALIGIIIGNLWSKRFSADQLKRGFGWFVLVMGLFMIGKELCFPTTFSQ